MPKCWLEAGRWGLEEEDRGGERLSWPSASCEIKVGADCWFVVVEDVLNSELTGFVGGAEPDDDNGNMEVVAEAVTEVDRGG